MGGKVLSKLQFGGKGDKFGVNNAMIQQKPTLGQDRAARIRASVSRVGTDVKARKFGEVREVLAAKHISSSTLRNWLKDPAKIQTAYRWSEFVEAIERLPDLEGKNATKLMNSRLLELGIGREAQRELAPYNGNYRVLHDFPDIQLNNLAIRVEQSPFVVAFAFKYRNKHRDSGFCDGLIVTRHGRLVFAGFSPSTMFQAVFRSVNDPANSLIRGWH